ncbi:MAG: hypothetical protein WBM54_09205 [Woeseia sp.]
MTIVILIFALLITVSGISLIVKPLVIRSFLEKNVDRLELHVFAVGARLLLGLVLVYHADSSRYPVAMHWLGWIVVGAALGLAVIGRQNFVRLLRWAMQLLGSFGRIAGLIAAVFGAFLFYAFV